MIDDAGTRSIAEAKKSAERLTALVQGWVNAEQAQANRAAQAELRLDKVETRALAAEARVQALEAALRTAADLAEEGWSYAGDYFNDKHDSAARIAQCRAVLSAPGATEGGG